MSDVLRRRLERAEAKIAILEGMIETRTRELYTTNERLRAANVQLEQLIETVPGALLVVGDDSRLHRANHEASSLLSRDTVDLERIPLADVWPDGPSVLRPLAGTAEIFHDEASWLTPDGGERPVLVSATAHETGEGLRYVCIGLDLRERKRMEGELRQAQKLESIGQLAAGVAHEINTPIQFVGDNLHFLGEAVTDLVRVIDAYEALRAKVKNRTSPLMRAIAEAEAAADLDYLRERAPRAAERGVEGVRRVRDIVSALKTFSHPSEETVLVDLAHAVETTLAVASNEYKYVADVVTEFDDVPTVRGNATEIHQVLLNLVVNAAHAIQDAQRTAGARGRITVRAYREGDNAVVTVGDDGCGIPPEVQSRIFDPFFTTKEIGRGTGQGLSIAHNVVVQRHGGKLTFDTTPGAGTTFYVRLPASDADTKAA